MTLALVVAVLALALAMVGVTRSIRVYGMFNGRVFSRPAAPWTLCGLGLVLVDGAAVLVWLLSLRS